MAVRQRQRELDLNQREVAERGGISDAVLNRVVNGRADGLAALTLRALSRGLGWRPDAAEALITRGEPPEPEDPLERLLADALADPALRRFLGGLLAIEPGRRARLADVFTRLIDVVADNADATAGPMRNSPQHETGR